MKPFRHACSSKDTIKKITEFHESFQFSGQHVLDINTTLELSGRIEGEETVL